MANQPLKGTARLVAAWHNSRAGFRDIWTHEEAFRMEFLVWLVSVPVAFLISGTVFQAAILISAGIFLLIVEILNSALEAVVDRIGVERHELSRMAKDLGSLAVLFATGLLAILWVAAFWQWVMG
ncbi:Diacylglycerol kinase [Sulfitobacter noctilucicola]|uniref:Diacylglycerol kinase n=1 Tax=Sulfitobacter noctilucicola TaxID=1342301 RepID=A0A7W6M9I8_9RHOB|nr:diacylglycerol kinase [Sulfitobacter noctilucicola]KIN63620.1 Diacylglycerol kinase [Sulfitobacter noctilucicola]MBB4174869.1 diacylglycerol kinase (ATP) [Sulfitobacter noctilucicola]